MRYCLSAFFAPNTYQWQSPILDQQVGKIEELAALFGKLLLS